MTSVQADTDATVPATTPEHLQAALDAAYVVCISTRKGHATACIPELGILTRAATVEDAHAEALRQREARIREFADEGLQGELPAPGPAQTQERLLSRLKVFLIKAAVVTILFLGAVNIIGNALRDTGYVLEKKLHSVTFMTPESVEKHRAEAALIAEKLGPIVREVLVIFDRSAARSEVQGNSTAKP